MEPDNSDLAEIASRLKKLEERLDALEGKMPQAAPIGKKISIKEFILTKNPNDDVQKTLGIAYFKEKLEGVETFNVRDLEDGFRKAKERTPSNINDKVNMNIKNGHLMEASEKKDGLKAWTLTNSGEAFVEANFMTKTTDLGR